MTPRLHVLLAREAPVGVVIRRGPSEWARVSLWHTDTDAFEHGAWFHGRLYERRCDLSPDGRLLAAFLRKGSPPPGAGAESWLAVSRPPHLQALALWWVGSTWHSGGVFVASDALWTGFGDDAPDVGSTPRWLRLLEELPAHDVTQDWTERTVLVNRLAAGGWVREPASDVETWRRPIPGGGTLVRLEHPANLSRPGGMWHPEFAVECDGELHVLERTSWADVDRAGRVVLARDGTIAAWTTAGISVLADLGDQHPDPQPAPAAASSWPRPPRI